MCFIQSGTRTRIYYNSFYGWALRIKFSLKLIDDITELLTIMNLKTKTRSRLIIIGLAILLLLVVCGGTALLEQFRSIYLLQTSFAIISLTLAIALPVRQKHLSFYSFLLLITSILFLASSVFQYAYDNAIRPLPSWAQMEFSRVMQPNRISQGFFHIGMGLSLFLFGFAWLKTPNAKKYVFFLIIGVGVISLLLGISEIINGFQSF